MTEPGTDLDRQDPAKPLPVLAGKELEETFRIAKALAQSGLFKDAKKEMEAFAKILAGRDLGLSPFEAMSSLHVIEGKIEASADLQGSRVKASSKYEYKVHDGHPTDEMCSIDFFQNLPYFETGEKRPQVNLGTSTFTMDDARQAGLADRGPWKKFPRNMLYARAMTNGVAWYCPDVMGGLRVYHEGEIEVRDVSAGSGDYTEPEPEELRRAIDKWAPPGTADVIGEVLEWAGSLGHAGLSNYGKTELTLWGQSVEFVRDWYKNAAQELRALQDKQESETRPSEDGSLTAEILEGRALQRADEADALEADLRNEGDALVASQVEELRAEAASLHDQAEAMKQMELG